MKSKRLGYRGHALSICQMLLKYCGKFPLAPAVQIFLLLSFSILGVNHPTFLLFCLPVMSNVAKQFSFIFAINSFSAETLGFNVSSLFYWVICRLPNNSHAGLLDLYWANSDSSSNCLCCLLPKRLCACI